MSRVIHRTETTIHPDGRVEVKHEIPTQASVETAPPETDLYAALPALHNARAVDDALVDNLVRTGVVEIDEAGVHLTTAGRLIAGLPEPIARAMIAMLQQAEH